MRAARVYTQVKLFVIFISFTLPIFCFHNCDSEPKGKQEPSKSDSLVYLNHSDSAKYVGMQTCRQCHQAIYETYIQTGMGSSFGPGNQSKSAGEFSVSRVHDKISDFYYHAFWAKDSLYIKEFRLDKKDTVHTRVEQVNYIIGSGQHTNSHLQTINGYINQMPMTFYSQKKRWDLPPGFEGGVNTRFSRKIGLECMTCHNGYPEFVEGSENKYKSVPAGIDCERCHGPGSFHVEERQKNGQVDTSKFIDYSIVNPSKLSIDAQFDICQRCHLQGNAVLKEGKSFFDYKPGQKLSDYISVFLPKYKNADDEFIMASHADRLKQSPCFIESLKKNKQTNKLKPYKDALTCVTCHNPHVSVRQTNVNVFNDACNNCHNTMPVSDEVIAQLRKADCGLQSKKLSNCVSCHMPVSGSTDIPHVSVHDHFIRKPLTKIEVGKIKTFVGLFSVNEKSPDRITRARAYIDQYEKFDQNPVYLDSAQNLLSDKKELKKNCRALIQLYFIMRQPGKILQVVQELGENECYEKIFTKSSLNNQDAWTAYRVAEANSSAGDQNRALKWFQRAVSLAPFNLEFRNKLGATLGALKKPEQAIEQFEFILKENPKFVSAYANLGYIKLVQGFPAEALRLYNIGKSLDPDNEALLLNLSGYYLYMKDYVSASRTLKQILKRNPQHQQASMVLKQLGSL